MTIGEDRMQAQDVACPVCDTLFHLPSLAPLQTAHCPRCEHKISKHRPRSMDHALALAVSAVLLLLCSTAYPFLGFAASGQIATMTLLDSAMSLYGYGQPVLGAIVFVLVFAAPCALLMLLVLLLVLIRYERGVVLLPWLARMMQALNSWNMVEVFMIGVLVSLAKISSMASVQLGYAFWAFIGFTLCTLAGVSVLDRVELWQRIRLLQQARGSV